MDIDKLFQDQQEDNSTQLKQVYQVNKELLSYFKNVNKSIIKTLNSNDINVIQKVTSTIEVNIQNLSKLKYEIFSFDEEIPDKYSKEWHKNVSYIINEMSIVESTLFLQKTTLLKQHIVKENKRLKLEEEKRIKLKKEQRVKDEIDRLKKIEEEKKLKQREQELKKKKEQEEKKKLVEKKKKEEEERIKLKKYIKKQKLKKKLPISLCFFAAAAFIITVPFIAERIDEGMDLFLWAFIAPMLTLGGIAYLYGDDAK